MMGNGVRTLMTLVIRALSLQKYFSEMRLS